MKSKSMYFLVMCFFFASVSLFTTGCPNPPPVNNEDKKEAASEQTNDGGEATPENNANEKAAETPKEADLEKTPEATPEPIVEAAPEAAPEGVMPESTSPQLPLTKSIKDLTEEEAEQVRAWTLQHYKKTRIGSGFCKLMYYGLVEGANPKPTDERIIQECSNFMTNCEEKFAKSMSENNKHAWTSENRKSCETSVETLVKCYEGASNVLSTVSNETCEEAPQKYTTGKDYPQKLQGVAECKTMSEKNCSGLLPGSGQSAP